MIEIPPPVELSIPKENQVRVLQLEKTADEAMGRLHYRQGKSRHLMAKGWSERRACKAHLGYVEASMEYRRANLALWAFVNHILPDTMVGEWNIDTVRMVATRNPGIGQHPLAQMFGGFKG